MSSPTNVLVTDFDGTMTKHDFYELVVDHLLPADTPDYWAEYRAGRMTHFAALAGYFAAIQADEATVLRLVDQMELDPQVTSAIARLTKANWRVVIASAGCRWYIDRLLAAAGVTVEVHANLGRFETGRGLLMEMPRQSPFFSPTHGIDKRAVVEHYLASRKETAFAGDGYPDEPASRLVVPQRRFARGVLAESLAASGTPFRKFESWSDVAWELTADERPPA